MKSIKKSPIFIGILSLIALFAYAKQEKVLQIFQNGEVIQEYNVDDIDYIEINDLVPTPGNANASVSNDQITISWDAVEGATYNVYRSPDNVNFEMIASNLTETTYTDTKPLQGTNFYRIKALINNVESGYTPSIAATLTNSELESGIYLGITSFNQALYNYPILQLNENSKDGFDNFIDGLTIKNGTLLYYSVDQALNTLQSTELPTDISTAAIVTFTDGLDQGSFMMEGVSYENEIAYLNALNNRIKNETVAGQPITAYSIGIRGKDVSDYEMFRTNLAKLASSEENATEVTSMAEVNAKFKEIAEQLSQSNYIQTVNLKIPGVSNGTIIRFTFDNVSSAENSKLYIEGKFNLSQRSLEEVKYVGLTSTSGTTIKGTVDNIFVNFTFNGVHTDNNVLIKSEFTDEWTYITSNNTWQINSEFDKTENSDIVTERSSAVIMLVLDCSSSLADDFAKAQTNAKDFISTLYQAVGGSENPKDEDTIYSTTPIDLSVAAYNLTNDTRYYLTYDQYTTANLNDYYIEGLTVTTAMGNFIISPKELQSDNCSAIIANSFYKTKLPDKTQALIITARISDIQSALDKFGFSNLLYGNTYLTSEQIPNTDSEPYNYSFNTSWGNEIKASVEGRVRGVISTESPHVCWTMPEHLKLAVEKDGQITYIDNPDEDLSQHKVLGVVLTTESRKIAVELRNAQTDALNFELATSLYGDVLPDYTSMYMIENYWSELNEALSRFGGHQLLVANEYWTNFVEEDYAGYMCHSYWGRIFTECKISIMSKYNQCYIRGVHVLP